MMYDRPVLGSAVKGFQNTTLPNPIQWQRIPLEPDQAHTARLPPGDDRLDGGGLQQGRAGRRIHSMRRLAALFSASTAVKNLPLRRMSVTISA
jgi:hypothetical protein